MFENPNDTQEFYNLHFSLSFTGHLNMSYQLMCVFPAQTLTAGNPMPCLIFVIHFLYNI